MNTGCNTLLDALCHNYIHLSWTISSSKASVEMIVTSHYDSTILTSRKGKVMNCFLISDFTEIKSQTTKDRLRANPIFYSSGNCKKPLLSGLRDLK